MLLYDRIQVKSVLFTVTATDLISLSTLRPLLSRSLLHHFIACHLRTREDRHAANEGDEVEGEEDDG